MVFREQVAFHGRSKTALRAEREILERHVLARFVDSSCEMIRRFHISQLAAHEAQDHRLTARHEAQRFEGAGALGLVLEEKSIDVEPAE